MYILFRNLDRTFLPCIVDFYPSLIYEINYIKSLYNIMDKFMRLLWAHSYIFQASYYLYGLDPESPGWVHATLLLYALRFIDLRISSWQFPISPQVYKISIIIVLLSRRRATFGQFRPLFSCQSVSLWGFLDFFCLLVFQFLNIRASP